MRRDCRWHVARDCVDKETTRSCVVEPHEVSPGDGLMIYRLLGAVGLVVLVWLAGLAGKAQIHSTRAEIERQDARIVELEERFAILRGETRRLGAPDRMLPKVTAGRPLGTDRR